MPSQGYITAWVFTSDAEIPIPDAAVTVIGTDKNGERELIAVLTTDRSGRTPVIAVDTPDVLDSLSPGYFRPFTEVEITAEHPLYDRIVSENAQVFPGTVTVQPFRLIPTEKLPGAWDRTERFDTPPQEL